MKSSFLFVFFLGMAGTLFCQQWKDSLISAREAYSAGKYAEAQRKFTAAQQLAPNDVDLTKDVGTSAYRNSDYKTAEDAFLSSAQKTSDPQAKARKLHNAGNAQLKQKNYKAAVDSYKEALRNNPDNEETRYNLAEAQRRLKHQQSQQNQNENSQENQQQDNQSQSNNNDSNQNQGNSNQNQSNQNNQGNNSPTNNNGQTTGGSENRAGEAQKLTDKKTDRMLDELMKKEMETKRRALGAGSGGDQEKVKSGKRW